MQKGKGQKEGSKNEGSVRPPVPACSAVIVTSPNMMKRERPAKLFGAINMQVIFTLYAYKTER